MTEILEPKSIYLVTRQQWSAAATWRDTPFVTAFASPGAQADAERLWQELKRAGESLSRLCFEAGTSVLFLAWGLRPRPAAPRRSAPRRACGHMEWNMLMFVTAVYIVRSPVEHAIDAQRCHRFPKARPCSARYGRGHPSGSSKRLRLRSPRLQRWRRSSGGSC